MAELMSYLVAALADEAGGAYAHGAALQALYEMLVLTDPKVLLAVVNVDDLATRLPALVSADQKGDVPVLAARVIAEAVDILPQWAKIFEKHGAVQALRDRLLAVDDVELELAEECLRALDAICIECPDECLRLDVATAVLQSFDVFSTRHQEVALKIIADLIEDCDEADVPKAMEVAPALYNLLQSADKTIQQPAISFLGALASGARRKAEQRNRQ